MIEKEKVDQLAKAVQTAISALDILMPWLEKIKTQQALLPGKTKYLNGSEKIHTGVPYIVIDPEELFLIQHKLSMIFRSGAK
ncbi:MAG: hypothetical protein IKT32_02185 [Clostridia bacterium]|nr:hypothetical protein [Clostridia bacterium]